MGVSAPASRSAGTPRARDRLVEKERLVEVHGATLGGAVARPTTEGPWPVSLLAEGMFSDLRGRGWAGLWPRPHMVLPDPPPTYESKPCMLDR